MDAKSPEHSEPQYAGYFRATEARHGTADKLEALMKGYRGLGWVLLANIAGFWLVFIGVAVIVGAVTGPLAFGSSSQTFFEYSGEKGKEAIMALFFGTSAILFVCFACLSYPQTKRIGFGLAWSNVTSVVAAILMGLGAALCCGIVVYAVLQQLVFAEMKKYGMKFGFFGPRKKDILAVIAQGRGLEEQG